MPARAPGEIVGRILYFLCKRLPVIKPEAFCSGADDETRDYQPVVITGVQPVKFLSTHSNALFSSFTRKSDVYNLVSF